MKIKNVKSARNLVELKQGRTDWYRIENKAAATASIHIYDEIGFFGVTAADMIAELGQVTANRITLHLNSPGGEVFDGLAIMQALRDHPAAVTVKVDSLAASIASVIAMAGDRVVMGQHASLMIHNGHGLCVGEAKDMRQLADLLDKTSDNIASVYAGRAGGDVAHWRGLMNAETWFDAQEAVDAGLADEIAPGPKQENTFDLSIYSGRATPAVENDLQWVVEDGPNTCKECGENADEGPIPEGEQFPSGHFTPPAHPNCECHLEHVGAPTDVEDKTSAPQAATPDPDPGFTFDPEQFRSAVREAVGA